MEEFRGFVEFCGAKMWGDFSMNTNTATFCTEGGEIKIGTILEARKPDKRYTKNFNTPSELKGKWEVVGIAEKNICGLQGRRRAYSLERR